jgi:hypothetical protein
MRNDWRVRAVLLLGSILAAAGCSSTTQPDTLGTRTASLHIDARADVVDLFDCYQIWANDDNGVLVYQGVNECNPANLPPTNRAVPWRYSLGITIIHRGSTAEELVTSLSGVPGTTLIPGDNLDDFISLTAYDPTNPDAPFKEPEERPGYNGLVQFLNGKQVSRGNPLWLETNNFFLGDPNILTLSPTFDFEVNSGDTVIVRARKQLYADSQGFLPRPPDPKLQINGTLTVGGIAVVPSGTKQSSIAVGAGVSFSFTVQ